MSRLLSRLWPGVGSRAGRGLVTLSVVGVAVLGSACGSDEGGVSVRQSSGTAVTSGSSRGGAEPTSTAGGESAVAAEESATPDPTVYSIEDLVESYGYPTGYDYAQLRIPKIGVDSPVGLGIVDGDQMGAPLDPATVMVYDFQAWPGLGGLPGQGKNAVFSGHVDLSAYLAYADVTYHGEGVFSHLELLVPGDLVLVDVNGVTLEYMVKWVEDVRASDGGRWAELLSSDVAVDSVTLYTCGGEFDSVDRTYADRVVVRAERI